MFKFIKTKFFGDSNLGLYGLATSKYALIGIDTKIAKLKDILHVDIHHLSIFQTPLIGLFASGNKNGLILTKMIDDDELKIIKKTLPNVNVNIINVKETTAGNLIICNDNGAIISELLKKNKKEIEDCLGVQTEVGSIAGEEIVGSCGLANNRGCLVHREANEEEMKLIESTLKVKVDVGTVSYGSPFIKSGLIVNDNGILVSDRCSGPELGRIMEVFE